MALDIYQHMVYYAACDECGELGPQKETKQEAEQAATEEGWLYVDGQTLCPLCVRDRAEGGKGE